VNTDIILSRVEAAGVIPVVIIDRPEDAVRLAGVLLDAGLGAIEITARTPEAYAAIEAVANSHPEIALGAGTLLTPAALRSAIDAGAAFGVSPGAGPVVEAAVARGFPLVPGIVTPTEVMAMLDLGIRHLKFFPSEVFGGIRAVRALAGPFGSSGVRFMPTGGIRESEAADYLNSPEVFAVGGTWVAPRADIANGRWDDIRARAATATTLRRRDKDED